LNVRRLEWLSRVHLLAMRDATLENPRLRPVAAEGVFADIFELHDTIVLQMREHVRRLSEEPTIEKAKELNQFWKEVIQPHAKAEDRTVWDLAREQDDPGLAQSADLLEEEHGRIDEMIAHYEQTIEKVESGEGDIAELVPLARSIWQRTELHFGKEEESVYRPLQEQVSADEFRPAIAEQNEAVGNWLREHGWEMTE
ncbi:MAG: hemerythrin domain-containing protein, partial [bacterium]